MRSRSWMLFGVAALLTIGASLALAGKGPNLYPPARSTEEQLRIWHLNQPKHWRGFMMHR